MEELGSPRRLIGVRGRLHLGFIKSVALSRSQEPQSARDA